MPTYFSWIIGSLSACDLQIIFFNYLFHCPQRRTIKLYGRDVSRSKGQDLPPLKFPSDVGRFFSSDLLGASDVLCGRSLCTKSFDRTESPCIAVKCNTSITKEKISDSVVLCETEDRFLHVQLIGSNVRLPKMHGIPPEVYVECSRSTAKSES